MHATTSRTAAAAQGVGTPHASDSCSRAHVSMRVFVRAQMRARVYVSGCSPVCRPHRVSGFWFCAHLSLRVCACDVVSVRTIGVGVCVLHALPPIHFRLSAEINSNQMYADALRQ